MILPEGMFSLKIDSKSCAMNRLSASPSTKSGINPSSSDFNFVVNCFFQFAIAIAISLISFISGLCYVVYMRQLPEMFFFLHGILKPHKAIQIVSRNKKLYIVCQNKLQDCFPHQFVGTIMHSVVYLVNKHDIIIFTGDS